MTSPARIADVAAARDAGFSAQHGGSELGKTINCGINVGLVFLSVFLMRRADAVLPLALSSVGVALIAFGLLINKHFAALGAALREFLIAYVQRLRPAHARDS